MRFNGGRTIAPRLVENKGQMLSYLTGNEYVAIPQIGAEDAGVYCANLLSSAYKGLLEFASDKDRSLPLFVPEIYYQGSHVPLAKIAWKLDNFWIPSATVFTSFLKTQIRWLAPVDQKGFAIILDFTTPDGTPLDHTELECALRGTWGTVEQHVNLAKPLTGVRRVRESSWKNGLVFEFDAPHTIAAFCISCSNKDFTALHSDQIAIRQTGENLTRLPRLISELAARDQEALHFCISSKAQPHNKGARIAFLVGFGQDEISAISAAAHLDRVGCDHLLSTTRQYLEHITMEEAPTDEVREVMNRNAMFCHFFSTGKAFDSEQFCCLTSRCTDYYVSAAYWDRDALFWTFPCILQQDRAKARALLEYAFTTQLRNTGIHSRFIDGTIMEPGMELDQLCSPVIELVHYLRFSNDYEFPREKFVQDAIAELRERVMALKFRTVFLFRTFLNSTDDVPPYPCVTFLNVLAWRFFFDLAFLDEKLNATARSTDNRNSALRVRRAIYTHCIKRIEGKDVFVYSVPVEGETIQYDPLNPRREVQDQIAEGVYDDPMGSLITLPYWGFCKHYDPVYEATVDLILSSDNPFSHAGRKFAFCGAYHDRRAHGPFVASIANQLLVRMNQEEIADMIPHLKMDNGLACESINADTGEMETGRGMASMAGLLAYSMYRGLSKVSSYGLPEPTADEIAKTEGAIRAAALRAGLPYPRPHFGPAEDSYVPPRPGSSQHPRHGEPRHSGTDPRHSSGGGSSTSYVREHIPRNRYGRPEVRIPDNIPDDIGNRIAPNHKRPSRPSSPYSLSDEEADLPEMGD